MPQTGRKGSCYLLAVHLLGLNTVLFYAYDGHFYLALSTFSLLAIDDSIFLNLRFNCTMSCGCASCILLNLPKSRKVSQSRFFCTPLGEPRDLILAQIERDTENPFPCAKLDIVAAMAESSRTCRFCFFRPLGKYLT